MDTMTRTLDAVNTAFSGIDPRTGKPCHRASHTKARLSNSSRNGGLSPRMVRQSHALGLHVAAGILNPVSGVGRCSACNLLGTLAHGGDATLELAHDIPSAEGGAMCWCSLTLQHLACNRAMRDDVTLSSFALYVDARDYAANGGMWFRHDVARSSYRYETFTARHGDVTPDFAAWRPLTPTAYNVQERALRAR